MKEPKDEKQKINLAPENIYDCFMQNKFMKVNKENFGWIFTVVILALLLALSFYLGVSGWYIKTEISYTTDLKIGQNVQVGVKSNQASAVSLSLEGSYLEGEKIPQIISVKNIDDKSSVYLRAKIFIYSGDNKTMSMNMVETVNWKYNSDDGYYYFNDKLSLNNKVTLCSHIFIDDEAHLNTTTKYIFSVIIEALDEKQNPIDFWGINPIEND